MAKRDDDFMPTVPDGTTLNQAVSILIKELRRGKELEAVYWARQIEGAGMWKYLFRRLVIFACEDVGLANPLAVTVVKSCRDAYADCKAESQRGTPDGNLIVHAVRVLANSEKNRENDDLKNVEHALRDNGWKAPIPEYAIDWHTREGRALYDEDEGLVLWLTDWSEVMPSTGPLDWRLWHWRAAVKEGLMSEEAVEAQAQEWNEQGRLRYGLTGIVDSMPRKGKGR